MPKNNMPSSGGFLDGLIRDLATMGAIHASRDPDGKLDPYKAAGAVYGLRGALGWSDIAELGTLLGGMGAFDSEGSTSYLKRREDYLQDATDGFDDFDEFDGFDDEYGHQEPEEDQDEDEDKDEVEDENDWREDCKNNRYGIDPDNYDSIDEFAKVLTMAVDYYLEGIAQNPAEAQSRLYEYGRKAESMLKPVPDWDDSYSAQQKKILYMKTELHGRYIEDYPHLFNKHWQKMRFCDIAEKAAKKKKSAHIPVEMFLHLAGKYAPITDLDVCKILDVQGCDEFIADLHNRKEEILAVIAAGEWTEDDCEHLTYAVLYNFLMKTDGAGNGFDLLEALLSANIHEDAIPHIRYTLTVYLEAITLDEVDEPTAEITIRLIEMCKRLNIPDTDTEIYSEAMDRLSV